MFKPSTETLMMMFKPSTETMFKPSTETLNPKAGGGGGR